MSKIATPAEVQQASILQALHTNWKPEPWQIRAGQALFRDNIKELFLQNARKTGKTEFLLYAMIRLALEKPRSEVYYICPYSTQARELVVANHRLEDFCPPQFIQRFYKTELRLVLKNGSFIKCAGADNSESLRGIGPDLLVLDEIKDISKSFIVAMLPNLAPKKAPVIFAGTPPPAEAYYTELAEEIQNNPTKFYIQVPTSANSHISPEFIEKQKAALYARGEQDVFAREWEGKFVRGGSRAIFPMLDRRHVVPFNVLRARVEKDLNQLMWFVVSDPGSSTTFAVLLGAHNPITQENFIFSEIYEQRSTHTTVGLIMAEIKKLQQALNLPPGVEWTWVCDEAATWFRNEVMAADPTIYVEPTRKAERPKDAGLTLIKDLLLVDKILMSNLCINLYKEMLNYVKKEDGTIPKTKDHLIDDLRYMLGSAGCELGPEAQPNVGPELSDESDDQPYFKPPDETRPLYSFEDEYD